MNQKTVISMAFPTELLKKIDALAKAEYTTRSDYIRQAMVRLTRQTAAEEAAQLKALSDELARDAQAASYQTDADFARLAKEIRKDRVAAARR